MVLEHCCRRKREGVSFGGAIQVKMEGRRGVNRWMQTMLLMLAIVSSLAMVLLWEPSPLAPNSSHGVVLKSPILSFSEPGRDLENLAKSDDSQPSQPIFPSLESTQGDLAGTDVNENRTKAPDRPDRDSSSSEVGTDPIGRETAADRQSFTDLSQQQDTTRIIVKEKEPITVADDKYTADIPTTNGTQSTNELEAIATLESLRRSNDQTETPVTTSERQNAVVTEKAMTEDSNNLKSNSTLQLTEPTGAEKDTMEEVKSQGSDSEKQSSTERNTTNVNNQPQLRRKSSSVTRLPDELQLVENENDTNVGESITSAEEDGKQAEMADAEGPDDNIRETTQNLGSVMEGDETGLEADVEERAHGKEAEVKVCDYTVGTWVLDKTRPLYSGRECTLWLSPDWACRLHNHPDKQMDRYRWQPAGCNLPVFNASAALEMLRNKVVAFAGDSLGRQQWQSLLCMLTHGKNHTPISDAASMFQFYTPHGARRPTGWAPHFDATNTTIVFKWTVTLARVEALNESTNALHLDRPEQFLSDYLPNLDVVILNSGHHWNDDKVQENGYRFYSKGKPLTDTSVPLAYNQTIHNIVRWFHDKTRNSGKVIYYRSLSPRHFRNGDWNTGGTCDTIRFEEDRQAQEERTTAVDTNADSAVKGTNVRLLNITALSMERGETHVSKYGRYEGGQDCLHWCLPGVPDTWNEILLAELAAAATTTTSSSQMNS